MDKKHKILFNNNDVIGILNSIKITLYLILLLLFINVIFVAISMNSDSLSSNEEQSKVEEQIPEYDVSAFKEVDYSKFKKLISSKGTHVIYIGRETCGYCSMFIPIMEEAQNKYDFTTNYFDISKVFDFTTNSVIDQTAYDEMSKLNEFFEENFLATPMVVVFKDGKYVDGTLGYQDIETYSQFLEKNNFKAK